jgi:hypothetical protein
MFSILISTKDRNLHSILKERNLRNSIKLILLGKYTQNLKILRRSNLNIDNEEKLKLDIGKSFQAIRMENPLLVNHKFLKNFRFIFSSFPSQTSYIKNSSDNIILSEKIKEIYKLSIQKLYKIPINNEEWLNTILTDPDEKNSKNFPRDLPAIFQFLKKIKIEFTDETSQEIIKKEIFRPSLRSQGDIIINN